MKHPNHSRRVTSRVSDTEYSLLEEIASNGGFVSVSALLKYAVYCCIRAFRHGRGDTMEDVPPEILQLFRATYDRDTALISAAIRNIRHRPGWRSERARSRSRHKADNISGEIHGLFSECEEEGARRAFSPDINRRL